MQTILSDDTVCLVCGTPLHLHKHHVYGGRGRRELSERYGCWCYLCAYHHNMSSHGIHYDPALDLRVKAECQRRWEKRFGSREDFIRTFGKSYL